MRYSVFCFLSFVFLMSSCTEPKPRKPKRYTSVNYFYKDLAKQNRVLNLQEKKYLKRFIEKDTLSTYFETSFGVWYTYNVKKTLGVKPKSEDVVEITYQITDINGNQIYPLQNKMVKLDKEEFLPVIHEGIKLMRKGETITFVIPSYRAYGVVGDGNKIKGNQPIICKITLLKF